MFRFNLCTSQSLAGALVLAPTLALADDSSNSPLVPDPSAAPGATEMPNMPPGASKAQRNNEVLSPTNPPEMRVTDGAGMSERAQARLTPETRAAIDPAQVQRVFGKDTALLDLASASQQQVLELQRALQLRGLYSGSIDGQPGPQTRAAISRLLGQQHAMSRRLLEQGRITGQLAASLGFAPDAPVPPSSAGGGSGQQRTPPADPSAPAP